MLRTKQVQGLVMLPKLYPNLNSHNPQTVLKQVMVIYTVAYLCVAMLTLRNLHKHNFRRFTLFQVVQG